MLPSLSSPSPSTAHLPVLLLFLMLVGMAPGCAPSSTSQSDPLVAGPMLGHISQREARVWFQAARPCRTVVEYWDTARPEQRWRSPILTAYRNTAYTVTHVLDSLQPERVYQYRILVNGQAVQRSYPLRFATPRAWSREPSELTFAMGSCHKLGDWGLTTSDHYPDSTDEWYPRYDVYESIQAQQPDFMLWLGDNLYLLQSDWTSRTGYYHRYSHVRGFPRLQPFLAAMPHYAIWDDHDYGPNNSDRIHPQKGVAYELFERFWANPRNEALKPPHTACSFAREDAEFILLDNRSQRTPNQFSTEPDATQWGEAQFRWLIDFLKSSPATFKFVATGGQVLNDCGQYETLGSTHPAERERLLAAIRQHRIEGVVFLTGDRHMAELSALSLGQGAPTVYDFTSSPLASGAFEGGKDEANSLRVPGSFVGTQNFGLVKLQGPKGQRKATLQLRDTHGELLWQHTIAEQELQWQD